MKQSHVTVRTAKSDRSSDIICQFLMSGEVTGTKDTLFYDLKLYKFSEEYSLI